MLSITYNTYDIPLDESFSMRFSWVNPACFFDKIPGAAGLGIDIPVNDYTQAVFGHPNRFEKYSSGNDRKFKGVHIRFNGVLLMSGVLNITSATSETYSAWLQSDMGAIGEEQREKFITDLDWDDASMVDQVLENKGSFDDATDDYCTGEITNKKFWEEIGKEIEEDEEYFNDDGELDTRRVTITQTKADHRDNFDYEVNADNNGIAKVSGNGCVVSPFLFLRFVLNHIFKVNKYFIDSTRDAFNNLTGYKNLALFNNYNIMQPIMVTETKYVYVTDPITGDRHINGVEFIKSISWELREFDYLQLVPRVNIGDLILGIQNMLNIVFVFGVDNRVAIIDREACLTGSVIDISGYFGGEWIIGERKDVSLKFVSEFDKNDSIFADNFHDLSERRADFKDDVLGIDDLEDIASPEYGEIRHVLWGDDWYEYKWDVDSNYAEENLFAEFDKVGWAYASCGPQPMFYGTGDEIEEIKTCISTLYRRNDLIYLTAMQNGSIKQMRNTWNNFSPRLLFHLDYNTVDVVNSEELTSLRWDGTDGLLEKRWKNWAAFWANRLSVEGDFNLPLNVMLYVINNITSKFKTAEGEFIIEEMEVEFGLHVIGKTHIKGYKV